MSIKIKKEVITILLTFNDIQYTYLHYSETNLHTQRHAYCLERNAETIDLTYYDPDTPLLLRSHSSTAACMPADPLLKQT